MGQFNWWNKWGDPCSLYADNTTIFHKKESDLALTVDTIFLVGNYTGLHLNLSKTIAFTPQGCNHKASGVKVDSRPVKYLGAFLGLGDLSEKNFDASLKKAQNNLQSWNKRQLTLTARVVVAKTFIASLFIHILNSVCIHTKQIQLIQQLLNDYLWRGCLRV